MFSHSWSTCLDRAWWRHPVASHDFHPASALWRKAQICDQFANVMTSPENWLGQATLRAGYLDAWRQESCVKDARLSRQRKWRHLLHHVTSFYPLSTSAFRVKLSKAKCRPCLQQLTCLSATLLWCHRLCFEWQRDVAVLRHSFDFSQKKCGLPGKFCSFVDLCHPGRGRLP